MKVHNHFPPQYLSLGARPQVWEEVTPAGSSIWASKEPRYSPLNAHCVPEGLWSLSRIRIL